MDFRHEIIGSDQSIGLIILSGIRPNPVSPGMIFIPKVNHE